MNKRAKQLPRALACCGALTMRAVLLLFRIRSKDL